MISTYTKQDAPLTIKALELGAFDFILKPSLSSMEDNLIALRKMFMPIAQALGQRKKIKRLLQGTAPLEDEGPVSFQDASSCLA